MSNPIPIRLASIAAALFLASSPLEAGATSALFHFSDFDVDLDFEGDIHAPYTYTYGCDGKPYCTAYEIVETQGDGGGGEALRVSTVRNGIGMEIGRYGFDWGINYDADAGWVDVGNSPNDFTLFLLDFDTPLKSFAADIERPLVLEEDYCDDECPPGEERVVYDLIQVYLWSEPGGTGDLVGHLTITPDDPLEVINFIGHISLASEQPFRSVNFGKAISEAPDCILGDPLPCGHTTSPNHGPFDNGYVIGHILVSTVPEPSTALLLGLGLVGLRVWSRSERR